MPSLRLRAFGNLIELPLHSNVHMKMVERGPRPSSIDTYLFRLATDCGVRFSFSTPVSTRKDFHDLPPGRIAATAVHDRERATKEFRRMNRWWKLGYLTRRMLWATHPWGPRLAVPAVLRLVQHVDQRYLWLLNPAVPGWMRLPKEDRNSLPH